MSHTYGGTGEQFFFWWSQAGGVEWSCYFFCVCSRRVLFLYIDLVSIQKEIGETRSNIPGPKSQIIGVPTQNPTPSMTTTRVLVTSFFWPNWSFAHVLVTPKNEIGALVSGSDVSKCGSSNVTKHCENFVLALVSRLQNFSFSPCIWMEIKIWQIENVTKKLTQGQIYKKRSLPLVWWW